MTGSLQDKNKIHKLLFLLDEIWFTLSKHANSQNNINWCFKNLLAVHDIPLFDLTSQGWVASQSAQIHRAQCCLKKQAILN
jgi:hypothetical protein